MLVTQDMEDSISRDLASLMQLPISSIQNVVVTPSSMTSNAAALGSAAVMDWSADSRLSNVAATAPTTSKTAAMLGRASEAQIAASTIAPEASQPVTTPQPGTVPAGLVASPPGLATPVGMGVDLATRHETATSSNVTAAANNMLLAGTNILTAVLVPPSAQQQRLPFTAATASRLITHQVQRGGVSFVSSSLPSTPNTQAVRLSVSVSTAKPSANLTGSAPLLDARGMQSVASDLADTVAAVPAGGIAPSASLARLAPAATSAPDSEQPAADTQLSGTVTGNSTTSLLSAAVLLYAGRSGICGNGYCEVGERAFFNRGLAGAPGEQIMGGCPQDCPYPFMECPANADGLACSSRGRCLASQGICDCYVG